MFAMYNKLIMDTNLAKMGVPEHQTALAKKTLNGVIFEGIRANYPTRYGTQYTVEMLYLYHKDQILTVFVGYDNDNDSSDIYHSLQTIKISDAG